MLKGTDLVPSCVGRGGKRSLPYTSIHIPTPHTPVYSQDNPRRACLRVRCPLHAWYLSWIGAGASVLSGLDRGGVRVHV